MASSNEKTPLRAGKRKTAAAEARQMLHSILDRMEPVAKELGVEKTVRTGVALAKFSLLLTTLCATLVAFAPGAIALILYGTNSTRCPVAPLSMWLLVFGCASLGFVLLTVLACSSRINAVCGNSRVATVAGNLLFVLAALLNLFLLGWFVAGLVWLTAGIHPHELTGLHDCDFELYGAARGFILVCALIPFTAFACCCTGCCVLLASHTGVEPPASSCMGTSLLKEKPQTFVPPAVPSAMPTTSAAATMEEGSADAIAQDVNESQLESRGLGLGESPSLAQPPTNVATPTFPEAAAPESSEISAQSPPLTIPEDRSYDVSGDSGRCHAVASAQYYGFGAAAEGSTSSRGYGRFRWTKRTSR